MATWTNTTESSSNWSNETENQSTFINTTKNGNFDVLLQEEVTDSILFEDGDEILLEEVSGDTLQTWTNVTEN